MKRNDDGTYQPGYIYELRCRINNDWHPFYVGETINKTTRLGQHQVCANNADETSTLVYRFIQEHLDANKIEWNLFEVDQYGAEGPEALEDEHIMRLLVDGAALKNTKKGNANWMTERMAVADDMRKRKVTSYRKYKEILSYEEQERKVNEANAQRVAQELARQEWEKERELLLQEQELIRQKQLAKQELIRQKHIEQMKELAEQARLKLERENAAKLAREEEQRRAWEADAPARAERLRKQTEELERRERERELLKAQQAKEAAEKQVKEEQERQIRLAKEAEEKAQRMAKTDANIQAHEERMKLVKAEEKKMLERAQERMRKILEIKK